MNADNSSIKPSVFGAALAALFSSGSYAAMHQRQHIFTLLEHDKDRLSDYVEGVWPEQSVLASCREQALAMQAFLRRDIVSSACTAAVVVACIALAAYFLGDVVWTGSKTFACVAAVLALWAGLFQLCDSHESYKKQRLDELVRASTIRLLVFISGGSALVSALIA